MLKMDRKLYLLFGNIDNTKIVKNTDGKSGIFFVESRSTG